MPTKNDVGDTALSRNEEGAVTAFQAIMLEKLKKNAHKGGWTRSDVRELFDRAAEEMKEAEEALERRFWSMLPGERETEAKNFAREAADVANFLMMAADVMGALEYPGRAK